MRVFRCFSLWEPAPSQLQLPTKAGGEPAGDKSQNYLIQQPYIALFEFLSQVWMLYITLRCVKCTTALGSSSGLKQPSRAAKYGLFYKTVVKQEA